MEELKSAILVIDEKVVSRKFYKRMLEGFFSENHRVLDIASGALAIHLCESQTVDCILVSNQIPDYQGVDFLKELHAKISADREVSVIVLAEEDNEEEAKTAIKHGAFDYFVKGRFGQLSLIQAVKNAMESARLHRELARSRRKLLETAHKAGMAEIANGVLHNIGNNMNSVATSIETITEAVEKSRLRGLHQVNELLHSMEDLFLSHPKGPGLLQYLRSLEERWEKERHHILEETSLIRGRVANIRADIYEQSSYASVDLFAEDLDLNVIAQDALRLQQGRIESEGVVVEELFKHMPLIHSVRAKLLLIVNNLIKNAIQSMGRAELSQKCLQVGSYLTPEYCCLFVNDNGNGISSDIEQKVFQYGFTTQPGRHGAGLHLATNAATELGGKLIFKNNKDQAGVIFTLLLPRKNHNS